MRPFPLGLRTRHGRGDSVPVPEVPDPVCPSIDVDETGTPSRSRRDQALLIRHRDVSGFAAPVTTLKRWSLGRRGAAVRRGRVGRAS